MLLGPLYTRSQGQKNLGPILGLQIGLPNLMVSFFSVLGPIQGHKVQHLLVTWGRLNFFSLSALTPSVKPLGLISTFAPELDLG
jgi:hypothetical protein